MKPSDAKRSFINSILIGTDDPMPIEQTITAASPPDRLIGLEVTPADIRSALALVSGAVHRTPLLRCSTLDARVGASVYSKAENLQRSGSFKIRGALHRLLRLSAEERERGVVAFSSGNHAQGVALAARMIGMDATIVMPTDAPDVKRRATAGYGARIVDYDRATEDREALAGRIVAERGGTVVPPFNDPLVIAGQGTVGLEIAQQLRALDVVPDIAVVPVGGGGLASGIAIALVDAFPAIRIVGVEPASADDARQSLSAGSIVTIDQPVTIADGVATQSIGTHTFPILSSLLDEIVTVTDDELLGALRFVLERMKQVVEPTGALTTAALLEGRVSTKGMNVVSILCGGNLDLSLLSRLGAS